VDQLALHAENRLLQAQKTQLRAWLKQSHSLAPSLMAQSVVRKEPQMVGSAKINFSAVEV
jgi:hypothetical protein